MHGTRSLLPLAVFIAVAWTLTAGPAVGAERERTARVAGGGQVTLAKPRFSSRELQARRPQMKALIPRVR